MKTLFSLALILFVALVTASVAVAEDNPLKAQEKAVFEGFEEAIPY